ncbi:hypothetical protein QVD17_04644 [Tagetes erecta]|uniref:Uncharacterized protein n=1 Tax=Tagetes erecta TaxID=13708 RepID=A0AAD8LFW7_TARER|nr:hypothetical protein QVD17_04644 [Tagetes erecta]
MQLQSTFDYSELSPSFRCYSREEEISRVNETGDQDFEFMIALSNDQASLKETETRVWHVFNRHLLTNDDVDRQIKAPRVGTYCEWMPKADSGSSPVWKKSSSTGSGSKRWIFRYFVWRSNSGGKQPMVVLPPKKVDSPKQKRTSGEVLRTIGRWKAQTSIHEQFYVQRRAENEIGKRKSYLPYRTDLVGLFANVNTTGKMLSV